MKVLESNVYTRTADGARPSTWIGTCSLPLSPATGYNLAANDYDAWHWTKFWDVNEVPEVLNAFGVTHGHRILDAGCGTGRYRPFLETLGQKYIGIDISQRMLMQAVYKTCQSDSPATFVLADYSHIPVAANSIANILCTRALSHSHNIKNPLQEFARIIEYNGKCILTDIHPQHPYQVTTVPTKTGKLLIETIKHSTKDLFDAVKETGQFQVVNYKEYVLADLCEKPPHNGFRKLYAHPQIPIFFMCVLERH